MITGRDVIAKGELRDAWPRSKAFLAWLRKKPCFVDGCTRQAVAMHAPRGRRFGDVGNAVNGCQIHHDEAHVGGQASFEAKYEVDLEKLALLRAVEWYQIRAEQVAALSEIALQLAKEYAVSADTAFTLVRRVFDTIEGFDAHWIG